MTRLLVALGVVLVLGGCANMQKGPCSLRDKNLVQYWYILKTEEGNTTDGKHLADRFLKEAIEKEVPLHCWRDR